MNDMILSIAALFVVIVFAMFPFFVLLKLWIAFECILKDEYKDPVYKWLERKGIVDILESWP